METSVVVAGGGATGLVLACGLLASGIDVRVLDSADEPATTSRALGLQARGAEVLDRVGALGDLPERSIGIQRVVVSLNGEQAAVLRLGLSARGARTPGLLVSQAEIEARLRQRLGELGGKVEWGTRVDAVHQETGSVLLDTTGGAVRAQWVVGCDGAHSTVRKAAGFDFPGVPIAENFLLADVRADLPLDREAAAVWLRGEEIFAAFPLPGGVWRLMAHADASEDVAATVASLMRSRAGLDPDAVREWRWTSVFRINRRLVTDYRRQRVLLAGDAAHIHSPLGGQGMNTGMGDAENLAWRLALVAAGRAEPALLDGYQRERRPVAADVLSATSGLTGLVLGEGRFARLLRDRVLLPLVNRHVVQRMIWQRASQLKVSYAAHRFGRRPRVGDRVAQCAPDNGFRWTLTAPPGRAGEACAELAGRRLGEVDVRVRPATRASLVRPDAHLAWRGKPEELDAYLDGVLGR
jgi:2-polyprenyl-6-methoxyphenol hydroxylase-like FAD-dependent oxidoreductase